MITTLTLNPAIDRTLTIENLNVNAVNRAVDVRVNAGGKGVNASGIIQFFGEDTTALGFAGGTTGNELLSMLDASGLKHDFVRVSENTRVNIKIVDTVNHTCTDINERGGIVNQEELTALKNKLHKYASESTALVLSGSVPRGIPDTVYRDMINELKACKAQVVLDTSGNLLKEGIKATPWLIKPNLDEFSEIIGFRPNNRKEIVRECRNLIDMGIEYVCVSIGEEGLILVSRKDDILVKPPKIKAQSTVGAGDAVAGSLAVSLVKGVPLIEAAKRACGISAASVMLLGTDVPSKDLYNKLYRQVATVDY